MAERTKNVMLVGLPHFLEQALSACFQKESWAVHRLRTAGRAEAGVYVCDPESREMANLFAVHNLDLLIYQPEKAASSAMRQLDAVLRHARTARVERVFVLSGDKVFAPGTEANEMTPTAPADAAGELLVRLETLTKAFRAQGLAVSILRLSELYGPGQTSAYGLIGRLFGTALMGRPLPRVRVPEEAHCTFLDVRDAVYAVYQATARGFDGEVLHIAGMPTTAAELYEICGRFLPRAASSAPPAPLAGRAILESAILESELGWRPRRPLAEGLRETWEEMKRQRDLHVLDVHARQGRLRRARLRLRLVPYLENAAGALVTTGISFLQGGSTVNGVVAFDAAYLYIGCMGLLYGKQQALAAATFSLVLLIFQLLRRGGDFVAMLYSPGEFLHFISYFFVAVLMGYFADRERFRVLSDRRSRRSLRHRYAFLKSLFKENLIVKDRLYRQIVNADDSIGRLYRIVSRLDSVETENIFTRTASVAADVLGVRDVVVYIVGKGGYYLRQKVRLGERTTGAPRSLRVEDNPYLVQMLAEKKIFVNRDLVKGLPDLAAPIVYEGRVIAVLQIYHLDFEQWSYYEQNLLSVTARLVSGALGRAYDWERETSERKHLDGTRILRPEAFRKVVDEFRERRRMQPDYPVALLPIDAMGLSYAELDHRIGGSIRAEDFIGATEEGVSLLLPDVAGETLDMVRDRLAKAGVETGESRPL